jgi:hypothetical protein
MSPSRKSTGPSGRRKSHALCRHSPAAAFPPPPPPHARSPFGHIITLESLGWRVVELRPSLGGGEPTLWRVKITRFDLDASMSVSAAEPDLALAELVRYASADARERG